MRNALQATAALLALAASASAAGWRVGVIAGSARDFEAAAAAVSRADDVELVNLRGKDAPATGLSALVAASQAMTSAEVKRVEDYARSGGLVIVMGDAGEYD
ncbi:MAG TPA: hypothetical protein P5137_14310, partial [Candidatus Brocadiia bacterium]|nr:hypothetical protein [Candidatus Brocadiia bacterium]